MDLQILKLEEKIVQQPPINTSILITRTHAQRERGGGDWGEGGRGGSRREHGT